MVARRKPSKYHGDLLRTCLIIHLAHVHIAHTTTQIPQAASTKLNYHIRTLHENFPVWRQVVANTNLYFNKSEAQPVNMYSNETVLSIHINKRGLSACLFAFCLSVCSDLEPKPMDGSPPNLAWTFPWTLWVTSRNFFVLTHLRGV